MLRSRLILPVAVLSLAIVGVPATAMARTGSIVIDGVSSPASNPGLLSIQAEATSPITSLTVHLNNASNVDVLDLTSGDLALTSGGPTDGVWTVTSPITQAQLPLGTYQVTVDATDQGSDSVTGASAGGFSFVIVPTVTLEASTTQLSFVHQSVTLTGSVTGQSPDGSVNPLADQAVTITGISRNWNTTTDSAGDYSLTITPNLLAGGQGLQERLYASVASSATMSFASSQPTGLTGQPSDVQVHARLSSNSANYGQPVTLSGTAEYQLDGIWKPLANTGINVTGIDFYDYNSTQVTSTTDGSGKFDVRLPKLPSATWTADVQSNQFLLTGPAPGPYPSFAPNSAFLTVRLPTRFTSPRVRFDPFGDITVNGCLGLGPVAGSQFITSPNGQDVELQYARTPRGPWLGLGRMNRASPTACRMATPVSAALRSPALSGYYRLRYAGGVTFEPAVSAVRHAATARTKIVHFNVSPRSVTGRGRITVSGQLQQQAKGWRGLPGGFIKILIRPQGSNTWYWYKKLHTGAAGRFRLSFADPVAGHWAALYLGDSRHLAVVSKAIYVADSGAAAMGSAMVSRFLAGHEVRLPALAAQAAHAIASPAAAPASGGTITVTASSPTSSVGQLALAFNATTAINGFTAHVITSNGTDVLDLPQSAFTLTSGNTMVGTWTVKTPISGHQLAFGSYQIEVDATDSGNDSISNAAAGPLNYFIEPTVTLKASPTVIGQANPTATLSGTVTGLWPDGSTGPIAGLTVTVPGLFSQATTDAAGKFSITVAFPGSYSVYVTRSDVAFATSPSVTISGRSTPTSLTAKLSTSKTSFGKTVTVSGTLTYKPGNTWVPLAGAQVEVVPPGYPQSAPITDSAGHYSATFTAMNGGPATVYFNGGSPFPVTEWLNSAQVMTKDLDLTLPTSITQFSASVDPQGFLHVHGCLGIEAIWSGSAYGGQHPVTIQYAPRPSGPWQRLGTISVQPYDSTCGIAELEASFTGSLPVRLARAYYRAHFPGEPQQSEQWQPSTGPVRLAWKYLTKISPFKVSPHSVAHGGRITISGRLLQHTSAWRGFGHQQILIIFRRPGSKLWYWIVKTKTSAGGRFSATVKDPFNAYWSAFYAGDAKHYISSPPGVYVRVG